MSIDRGMDKDVVCIYTEILLAKIIIIMAFAATWRDLEIIILSEAEKDKYHMIAPTRGILKNDTNELIYKTVADINICK